MPIKDPPHPGDFIRTEIIEPAGLSVTAAALHVSRPALSSLLNGKANLSGDMALRIEKAFGVKMDTLMRMQSAFDIAQTRKREKEIRVPRVSDLLRQNKMEDVLFLIGGIIPEQDFDFLKKAGVSAIFNPGTPMDDIAVFIRKNVKPRGLITA